MMRRATITFFFFLLAAVPWTLWAQSPSPVKGPADLYFLAVGISNHVDQDLGDLPSAKHSAEVVARAMSKAGATYGLLLTSEPGARPVSKNDVRNALIALKARIRADNAIAPRVLVYVMSHGVADGAGNFVMLFPGNLSVEESPVTQEYAFRLAKRTIWSTDILTSLMTFRRDERLAHLDPDFESDQMSDQLGVLGLAEYGWNQFKRSQEIDRQSSGYGSRPFDNAPIPFVVLLDNCSGGVATNLSNSNSILQALRTEVYGATLDVGRVFYAVEPGKLAAPLALPIDLTDPGDKVELAGALRSPNVGPLAVHLKNVLQNRDYSRPMSLRQFANSFASSGTKNADDELPKSPYTPLSDLGFDPLRNDVADVDFIPVLTGEVGVYDNYEAQGGKTVRCCERLD